MSFKVDMMTPSFSGEELSYVKRALDKQEISTYGENIDEMTNLLLSYVGRPYGKLIANGTAGVHLALKAIGIDDGDKVFCPTFTYCGTAYPILYERGTPVFLDCKKDGTLDPVVLKLALEKYKDDLPKAVIVVDTYGAPADYDEISSILSNYGVPLISDSAESLGGEYKGKKCGSFGDLSVISFSYSKLITTSLGGMVLSDRPDYMEKIAYLANQAKAKSSAYLHKEIGYNYLMSNLLAGVGIPLMKNIDTLLNRKTEIFNTYKNSLSHMEGIGFTADLPGSSYWQNGIILPGCDGEAITEALRKNGIEARRGFNPMHCQEAFSQYDYVTLDNISPKLFQETVLLPSGVGMTQSQQEEVITVLKTLLEKGMTND